MFDDINPSYWGKYFWKTMHYVTFAYPDNPTNDDKQKIIIFITAIANVLPCVACRDHFNQLLKEFPLNDFVLQNKKNLILWLHLMHNIINKQIDKPQYSLDYIKQDYFNDFSISYVLLALIFLLIIGLFIYFFK